MVKISKIIVLVGAVLFLYSSFSWAAMVKEVVDRYKSCTQVQKGAFVNGLRARGVEAGTDGVVIDVEEPSIFDPETVRVRYKVIMEKLLDYTIGGYADDVRLACCSKDIDWVLGISKGDFKPCFGKILDITESLFGRITIWVDGDSPTEESIEKMIRDKNWVETGEEGSEESIKEIVRKIEEMEKALKKGPKK